MGKKTPEQKIKDLSEQIREKINRWKDLNENGGYDPFWPDGMNMNLTRNHILYAKHRIMELCEEHGIQTPGEMYFPVPPEVHDNYMATLHQKERVKRLRQQGNELTTKRIRYETEQLLLF